MAGTSLAADGIISAEQAYSEATNETLTLIDIRSPKEWPESGVPKGSKTITMHNPNGREAFLEAIRSAVSNDLSRPVAVICAVGGRSRWARRYLTKNGFSNVVDVSEGVFGRGPGLPGWIKRGLRLEKCAANDTASCAR